MRRKSSHEHPDLGIPCTGCGKPANFYRRFCRKTRQMVEPSCTMCEVGGDRATKKRAR